jgi:hypothetical protein
MELASPCHACAFFHNREEEYRVLLPFTQEVLTSGKADGFGLTRFWANMAWALAKYPAELRMRGELSIADDEPPVHA